MKHLIALFFLIPSLSFASSCLVDRVIDGDSFICGGGRVRIAEIDAPENKQPYGFESKGFLESLILGSTVGLNNEKEDRYGRILATVLYEGQDVGMLMVQKGMAWHYKQYSKSKVLAETEKLARERKIGLWSEENPVAPWEFRKW